MVGMHSHEVDVLDSRRGKPAIIWALAWPAILEQVLQVSVNYVDSAMVGTLGAAATASISLNISTIWLVNGFMNAIATGFAVLMARSVGERHYDEANRVVRQSILTEAAVGLLLVLVFTRVARSLPGWLHADPSIRASSTAYLFWIAAGYLPTMLMIGLSSLLRLAGDTWTPLVLNGVNNLCNIILNLFFIFPSVGPMPALGFGVAGAAMATSLAAVLTTLLLLYAFSRRDRHVRIIFRAPWTIDRRKELQGLRLSVPIIFERCTLSLGQIVLTGMVSGLGITALAAHYLANTAEQIGFLPPSGFATAATTLVAQSLGAGDRKLAKEYATTCIRSGFALMVVMATLMFVTAPHLLALFTRDAAVVALGACCLRIEAFGEPGLSLQQLVCGVLRGSGDTKMPFVICFTGMWVIRLPLAWLLLTHCSMGLEGVWIAMATDLLVRGAISVGYYRTGRWAHVWKA